MFNTEIDVRRCVSVNLCCDSILAKRAPVILCHPHHLMSCLPRRQFDSKCQNSTVSIVSHGKRRFYYLPLRGWLTPTHPGLKLDAKAFATSENQSLKFV